MSELSCQVTSAFLNDNWCSVDLLYFGTHLHRRGNTPEGSDHPLKNQVANIWSPQLRSAQFIAIYNYACLTILHSLGSPHQDQAHYSANSNQRHDELHQVQESQAQPNPAQKRHFQIRNSWRSPPQQARLVTGSRHHYPCTEIRKTIKPSSDATPQTMATTFISSTRRR